MHYLVLLLVLQRNMHMDCFGRTIKPKLKVPIDYTAQDPAEHAPPLRILKLFAQPINICIFGPGSDPTAPKKRNRGDGSNGRQTKTQRLGQKAASTCVELENSFKWTDISDKVSTNDLLV